MSKLGRADTPGLHKTQTLHVIKGFKTKLDWFEVFPVTGSLYRSSIYPRCAAWQRAGQAGRAGWQLQEGWGWSRACQRCSLSAAGGERMGIPGGEGCLGNPSPSLRVLLVHGAVFAVCSNFNVTEEQHVVGEISNQQGWVFPKVGKRGGLMIWSEGWSSPRSHCRSRLLLVCTLLAIWVFLTSIIKMWKMTSQLPAKMINDSWLPQGTARAASSAWPWSFLACTRS